MAGLADAVLDSCRDMSECEEPFKYTWEVVSGARTPLNILLLRATQNYPFYGDWRTT